MVFVTVMLMEISNHANAKVVGMDHFAIFPIQWENKSLNPIIFFGETQIGDYIFFVLILMRGFSAINQQ
jgi:hypothetical protein